MSAVQPDLFQPLCFYFEVTGREAVTERRWKPGSPPSQSYQKTVVVWFAEVIQAPDATAALAIWREDHPRAQLRGVINRGPVESD